MARSPLPPPPWTPADPVALRDALAQAKAATKMPGPSMSEYLFDLGKWLQERILGALERVLPWTGLPVVEKVSIYGALAAALLAVLTVLVIALRRWRAARKRRNAKAVVTQSSAPPPPPGDAAWWREELARRLAAGNLRGTLEAAWWWTARRIDPPGLDPSWTSGDLLRASDLPRLHEPLRRLDRQLWGGTAPERAEVDAVVRDLSSLEAASTLGAAP
jgi:hypothetical protein